MGDVGQLDPGGLQLVADAVGLGEVLLLLRILAGADLRFDLGIGLAALGDNRKLAGNGGFLLQLLALTAFSIRLRLSTLSKSAIA